MSTIRKRAKEEGYGRKCFTGIRINSFAGLATGVGSLIAFLHQEQIQNFYP